MASFDLAQCYSMLGEHPKALRQFKKTIQIRSDLVWAYYHIAAILSMENRRDESITWLKRALIKGFSDWNHIERDKRLTNIRETESFRKLVLEWKSFDP